MHSPQHNSTEAIGKATSQEGNSPKQLIATARRLAVEHAATSQSRGNSGSAFIARLEQQKTLLQQVYNYFVRTSIEKPAPSYAAEWFLDNHYLLERTQRQVLEDFPAGYYAQLPKVAIDDSAGSYPRIFDVVRHFVAAEGCEVAEQRLRLFLQEYQQTQNLRIGELWAVPIMLRVVLLESIIQAAFRLASTNDDVSSPAFHMDYALRNEEIVAACVSSVHMVAEQDWKAFFESVSGVEQALGNDPAQIYDRMDFETRDRYRKAVEELARASGTEEIRVAEEAFSLAQAAYAAAGHAPSNISSWKGLRLPRTAHVGFYLIDRGRTHLERQLGYRPGAVDRLKKLPFAHPTFVYLGSITAVAFALLWVAAHYLMAAESGLLLGAISLLLLFIPVLSITVSLVNWVLTLLISPRVLPKLNFTDGIPDLCCTAVVVPCMLTDDAEVSSLLHQLERHYLRNPDPNLLFALLSDFSDSDLEQTADDEGLLDAASEGIRALNRRYPDASFYLFHRRRLWNPQEEVWMGWERKRGKLHEFNRLLRGAEDTSFSLCVGDLERLSRVRYVITLDADTILPRDNAALLVGTLAHPLNRAQFDEGSDRVVAGYTLLQPRTEVKPKTGTLSLFTRVFAGDTGLDLYTRAVSDVYQDLFDEGIYVGKGIYDVDAFERSLRGRVPENALLSHDLFEGIQGRAALVSDIRLYEDYPSNYLLQVHRSHRWVRGDWQLLPWLLPIVPTADGWRRNRLQAIDLWKISDNLRRSLLAPVLLLVLIAGWTILPGTPFFWTFVALLTPATQMLASLTTSLTRVAAGDWREVKRPLRDSIVRWLLFVAFLPYEAVLNVDAILTTLVRLLLTRRNLLQWTTSAHSARLFGEDVSADLTWKNMLSSFLVAAILGVLLFIVNPAALEVALPLLVLWSLAPELAYWINRPEPLRSKEIGSPQRARLRRLARRTWFFYERFVGPEDNWLPPDHFQEAPKGVVAHRTSPTNIGLYLTSTIAAHDFGYIDPTALKVRLHSTFDTLQKLERHRGHFLNWIDTATLVPLPPRYISTVDSGNLAGCLIALEQALADLPDQPAWRWARWQGLLDLLALLIETIPGIDTDEREPESFALLLQALQERILSAQDSPSEWPDLLEEVIEEWQPRLDDRLVAFIEAATGSIRTETLHDCRLIIKSIHDHCRGIQRQSDELLPWLRFLRETPSLFARPDLPPELVRAWQEVHTRLAQPPTLRDLAAGTPAARRALADLQAALDAIELQPAVEEARAWAIQLRERLDSGSAAAQNLIADCKDLERQAGSYVAEMDFSFLFSQKRQVFHIGYNLDAGKLDDSYYDLLASESRIASLVAIAKNDVPSSHWLHLGRPVTDIRGQPTLLSWSGTMFEYLMPPLLFRTYDETLLASSMCHAIRRQIGYGAQRKVPWGISEAGYYAFDAARNYQYRAFGVPGLGLKRGLAEDTVIAPYASLLALPLTPDAVLENMDRLDSLAMKGRYGYYEAVDFTQSRLAPGETKAIVRSYMAHHQGMIMLALLNFLQDEKMIRRFHSDPRIQSVELLLQEQIPQGMPLETPAEEGAHGPPPDWSRPLAEPWHVPWQTPVPAVHFLSNGRYQVALTNAGAGYSRWQEIALTRWRPDTTLDAWGQWLYVEDRESGARWSAGLQPTGARPPEGAELVFHPHKAAWHRRDHEIVLRADVVVAPDDDVEIRRISLYNDSDRVRRLRVTSYAEVVLAEHEEDQRHPAFVKLFVESEYLSEHNALLFRRRLRSGKEKPVFMAHMLLMGKEEVESRRYETDRRRFLGRNNTIREPQALRSESWLSETTGATLDPIMSLGQEVELEAYATVELALVTLAAGSRQDAETLLGRYRSWSRLDRAFKLARGRAERQMQKFNLDTPLEIVQGLLSLLLYPHAALRADQEELAANSKGQPGLWAYGLSGDHPILLLRLSNEGESALLQELLRVHSYWHSLGLKIDLVILSDHTSAYQQELSQFIHRIIRREGASNRLQKRGGIFVISTDQTGREDQHLLLAAARVHLDASQGSLSHQVSDVFQMPTRLPGLQPTTAAQPLELPPLPRPDDLLFDNGTGGFSPARAGETAGKEYIIYLRPHQTTPAPWINVIANPQFGFLVSESGGGYTWAVNSGENRLTPWRNDPVSDSPAEAIYLRDEETAEVWSPTPQPAPAAAPYLVRHGAGYTIFEHHSHGLRQEVRLFAAVDAPVKIVHVRLVNASMRQRRLTATYYAEWVLGTTREKTQQYLIPEYMADAHALLVRNPYNVEFDQRVAFLSTDRQPHNLTTDRTEFLGRLGSLQQPAALRRIGLEGNLQAGLDTCGVIQLHVDLAPGAEESFYFLLGQGSNREEVLQLLEQYQDGSEIEAAFATVHQQWDDILGTVQVDTPDPAMNILLNRWLLYQTLSCRLWGRSALYQSSGAYGFRDQLQDVMALIHARPDLAREHVLRAARHQFEAGDVLHWWHPPSGRGVRTRIKDDLLWLPFVTAHYVRATGDQAILDEPLHFLQGEPLEEGEEERYGLYSHAAETHSLLLHCLRALKKGTTRGRHGLPLMGTGDWNDGMNRVGIEGEGESVWLGWFLYATLNEFAALCEQIGRTEDAAKFRDQADAYREALEMNAWDGEWYRRAYYDDGTPLGSSQNEECQIDAIAQSWSVLSGGAGERRKEAAMASLARHLIDWDARLLLLFTPAFDQTDKDPGYIKAYPPGIRENGGQYTHAALWSIWSFAELGQGEKAEALFRLANPIYRSADHEAALKYEVEPYVIAADVYSSLQHEGRGGWTWYTGSSGWMYRLGLEAILGVRRKGPALDVCPRIPSQWPEYTVVYRYGDATYRITVVNAGAEEGKEDKVVIVDGVYQTDGLIPLRADGREHHVEVEIRYLR